VQGRCWLLGADEGQSSDMLPEAVSMGFPLVGDLSRFGCFTGNDDLNSECEYRRVLVEEFRLAYPGALEAREHPARRIADPFGLWLFSKKAGPQDLVVVHLKKGESRKAVAIAQIIGPYFFVASSPWPHRLPVVVLSLDQWMLPNPYSGWGNVFGESVDDSLLTATVEARIAGCGADR
jgi:hypothetical protein